jgi:hypothetical protein
MAVAISFGCPPRFIGTILDAIHSRRLATLRMQFGMNESRPDAVDSNILFRDFLRQTDGESVHGSFGCGIVDVLAR